VSGLVLTGASDIAASPSLVDASTLGRSRLGGQRSACGWSPRCGRIGCRRPPGPGTGTGLTVTGLTVTRGRPPVSRGDCSPIPQTPTATARRRKSSERSSPTAVTRSSSARRSSTPTGQDINARGLTRRHIIRGVEASLKRLRTDLLDFYFVHAS
jgi:hypothetical protein